MKSLLQLQAEQSEKGDYWASLDVVRNRSGQRGCTTEEPPLGMSLPCISESAALEGFVRSEPPLSTDNLTDFMPPAVGSLGLW